MNVGQVLETHLGWAANELGFRAVTPVFDGASDRPDRGRARPAHGSAQQAGALSPNDARTGTTATAATACIARTSGWTSPKLEEWLNEQGLRRPREILDDTRDRRREAARAWSSGSETVVGAEARARQSAARRSTRR